ncbi:MAG: hypothetical protein J2P21_22815 [Chloracidobacterium sp.]|nr:hypothetical protein [Chloracidobacterium sp.]
MGFQTGDIVKADIPHGKFAGRHVGRVTIRQRPSFKLKGFDAHPKYLKRMHQADGFESPLMGLIHSLEGSSGAADIRPPIHDIITIGVAGFGNRHL